MDFDDLLLNAVRLFRRAPRRARALPEPLHPHPDRRVPGHQRRPERTRRAAGRRAPQHRGGGGQRPVGLPVPRRRHLQHPRLRAGLSRRHRHHPRPELPLDPDHPRRRQRRHHQQRVPQAEVAVDRPGGGRADRPLPGRGRARRGRVGGPRDRPPALRPGSPVGRRRHLLPDQRPVPRPRGGHGPGRGPLQGGGRAPSSTTARRSRTSSPTCGCWSTRTTRSAGGGSSTSPSGAWATPSVAKLAGFAGQRGLSFGEAVAEAGEAGVGGKAGKALEDLADLLAELRAHMAVPDLVDENGDAVAPGPVTELVARPRRRRRRPPADRRGPRPAASSDPASWSRPWWSAPATGTSSWPRAPSRRSAGWRTSTSWSAWPTSTGPWPSSWRPPRWWPTRTSSTATAPRSRS